MRNFGTGFLLIVLHLVCPYSWGQTAATSSEAVAEQLYVHFDKSFYTTGETIWYKVYLLNPNTAALQSEIIYVDLLNKKGEMVMQQKLKRVQRTASGSLVIPFDLAEGYYQLRCYTQWNLNFGKEAVFYSNFPIYNAWEERDGHSAGSETRLPEDTAVTGLQKQDLSITLKTDKDTYLIGEKVTLLIEVTDASHHPVAANLSVSVVDSELVQDNIGLNNKVWNYASVGHLSSQGIEFEPEKTVSLNGKILDPATSEPVTSQFISVHFIDDQSFINTAVSKGQLHLDFPDLYSPQIIQIHNHNPFQEAVPAVEIQSVSSFAPVADIPEWLPERTPVVQQYLEMSRLRRKLDEIFYASEAKPLPETKEVISLFNPDKSYLMKDYQLLKTVEEFVEQVFTKVRISEKTGKKTVRLFNPLTQKFMEDSPWYMVNGYLTQQEDAILAMPVKDLEKLDLFLYRNTIITQFPQLMIRNGIIAITTKDGKIPQELISDHNSFTFQGFAAPKDFTVPVAPENSANKMPDFRPLIYWNPEIVTNESGKASLSFPTSKAISRFRIQVEGISSEGKMGANTITYEVQFPEN